eukprot:bmy_10637T0
MRPAVLLSVNLRKKNSYWFLIKMEKYENLGLVGEGSYGMVMKCRNKDSGRIVAIKKFLESDDDKMVKKIAMREIKLLKQLRHENLVNLLEVCFTPHCFSFRAVDVWAIGCLVTEMLMGEPLFPGDSDIDQLYHIMVCLGNLIPRHQELFYKNPVFAGVRLPEIKETVPLERRYPRLPEVVIDLAKKCLHIDPDKRPFCAELLHHDFFHMDGFAERFSQELQLKVQKDARNISLSKKPQNRKKEKEKDDSLGEERKTLVVQDTNADPKIKDSKAFKIKGSKMDGEKVEKVSRASNASCLNDNGMNHIKTVPSTSLRDCSNGSMGHTRNPGMAIPPLTYNLSAVAPTINSGMGTISRVQSYRVDEKTKKYCIPFVKPNKHSPAGVYNINVTTSVASEKSLLQANKKRREYSKRDVRLPELNYNHLPELKALEGIARNSRLIKKENKNLSVSRIPSLVAIDLHTFNTALHQVSGSPLSDDSEASLPRVEQQH